MKKTPMKSFEIIKEMYEHFVKKSRKQEPKLMVCEKEDFDNVETALKDYEKIKQTKFIVVDDKVNEEDLEKLINQRMFTTNLQPCKINLLFDEQTRKKLKALEIIKNKEVNVHNFKLSSPYEKWNIYIMHWIDDEISGSPLTKEEYILLKEVLL